MAISFTVPLVPPSVNHYKVRFRNGRTVVSIETLGFKAAVAAYVRGEYVQGKRFRVEVNIVLGQGDRGDIDNYLKLVLDGLADCGAFRDLKGKRMSDAHVTQLSACIDRDERPAHGRTEITVAALVSAGKARGVNG